MMVCLMKMGLVWRLLLLLCLAGLLHAQEGNITQPARFKYAPAELAAMRALQAAWTFGEPGSETSHEAHLHSWNASALPCYQNTSAEHHNWKGVQCLMLCGNFTRLSSCDVRIISLTLDAADIHGSLPPEIGNLSQLATLALSGNPNLSGPIQKTLEKTQLEYLDLSDNGLTGSVPVFNGLWTLLYLDLSGNRLSGPYPREQLKRMVSLQTLNLAGNAFVGEVPEDAFQNMTQLETVNLSSNGFVGPLPIMIKDHHLQNLDFSSNKFTGLLPDYSMIEDLQHVNLSNNQLTGTINLPSIFDSSVSLDMSVLDLSNNLLSGPVPLLTSKGLGSLEELHLDNNNITGTLDITYLSSKGLLVQKNTPADSNGKLRLLSLVNNQIMEVISEEWHIDNTKTLFRLAGNPYCLGKFNHADDAKRCYCLQICFNTVDTSKHNRQVLIISTSATAGLLLLVLILVISYILHRSAKYKRYLLLQVEQKFAEFDVKPTIFSFSELRAATRDFHNDNMLGRGGYGAVYKGVLASGNVVAVKQLFVKSAQGIDDFLNEIVLITGMKHRNLVSLKGCCLRENQRILVYEYVENDDLDVLLLSGGQNKPLLTWAVRRNICLGVARGLHYLHALAHPRIIHRDIKAANILMDKNYEPKIADFGLALLFPDEQSHIMTIHVAGTKGYLAPEYASMGQLSDKVDVFSFGVLALEIISGRRNIIPEAPEDEVYLSQWAWALHDAGKTMDLVDKSLLLLEEDELDVQRVINIALLCLQTAVEKRPTMSRVVAMLQGDSDSEVVVLGKGGNSSESILERDRLLEAVERCHGLSPVAEERIERTFALKDKLDTDEPGSSSTPYDDGPENSDASLIQLSGVRAR